MKSSINLLIFQISKEEPIVSCFQNKSIKKACLAGIVEGCDGSFVKAKGDGFGFAGSKQLRLTIGSQHLCRFSKLSLGSSTPKQDRFSACHISGIGYLCSNYILYQNLIKVYTPYLAPIGIPSCILIEKAWNG